MAVLRPEEYFIWGVDYRVPVKYGLLDKRFLDEQRLSSTYSSETFARESMSIWTGNANDSWFNSNQLIRYRKLLKCERKAVKEPTNPNAYYVISCDVGRYRANSAVMVFKVLPNDEYFNKKVVYTEVINGENLYNQAVRLKQLIALYLPREVVIDGNGLGSGLIDAMVRPSLDEKTGELLPEYYVFNDDDYLPPGWKATRDESEPNERVIIYNLKAGAGNTDIIHANCFSQINSGRVSFLANERIVKEKLLATKKGQKMSMYDRKEYLLPFEMTSRLMDELNNLKLKPTGVQNQIKVEQISSSINKDRFSSLEYGLYRIKEHEDRYIKKKRKKRGFADLIMFSPKKGVK